MANVLVIGGTGNISSGIIKALRQRFGEAAKITVFNRGKSEDRLGPDVMRLHGDRNDFQAFHERFAGMTWDAVIDMICFTPQQAGSLIQTFRGKTPQLIFCSTVCTYGNTQTAIPTTEATPANPISTYGKNKLACERLLLEAGRDGAFTKDGGVTIFRPSHTFGPGNQLHGQTGNGGSPAFLDRLKRGLPTIVSGDGNGLWQMAFSEDVGLGFAYAVGRRGTLNEIYNVVSDRVMTWDEVTQGIAAAMGYPPAKIVHIATDFLLALTPERYGALNEIFRHHGVYSNAKIHRDIPEYREAVGFAEGIRRTVAWLTAQGRIPAAETDSFEPRLIELHQAMGEEARRKLAAAPAK